MRLPFSVDLNQDFEQVDGLDTELALCHGIDGIDIRTKTPSLFLVAIEFANGAALEAPPTSLRGEVETIGVYFSDVDQERAEEGIERLKDDISLGIDWNCASFTAGAAGIMLKPSERFYHAPSQWDFEPVDSPTDNRNNFGRMIRDGLNNGDPTRTSYASGHWYVGLADTRGVAMHVIGGNRPLALTRLRDMRGMYFDGNNFSASLKSDSVS